MPTSAPGSSVRVARGFTLLELLVVVAIIAVAAAGVSFAVRDASGAGLEREARRLAALLETARAKSRLTGQPVRWVATEDAFRFDGLAAKDLPSAWLVADTRVVGTSVLFLGPEPIIGPQSVVITSSSQPGHSMRVATDGLRPFIASTQQQ